MNINRVASRIAPRLHHQRKVRIYFFPWVLCACAFIIAFISLHIGSDFWLILLLWAFLVVAFILKDLTSPQSLITRYYYQMARPLGYDFSESKNLDEETVVYINYDYPPLFLYRGYVRWGLYFLILLELSAYAIYQSGNPPDATMIERAIATFVIILLMLLIYRRFVSMPVDLARSYRIVIWTIFTIWIAATFVICLYRLQPNNQLTIGTSIAFFFIILSQFTSERLWVDSYIRKDVMDRLTQSLLTWPQNHQELNGASARIGQELRYDRVFILIADDEFNQLIIKDQYGVQKSIYDHPIPFEKSICGRAWRHKTHILWNNVKLCPYFYAVEEDTTAAEIAVPIMHHDEMYGILDAQSNIPDVFGPADLDSLKMAAQALGTALAASRSKTFFDEALNLWQEIDGPDGTQFLHEKQVFELFAQFAHKRLRADTVIYFPLSLADCPTQNPFTSGEFLDDEPIIPPRSDPTSSLVCLIKKWEPYFEELVTADSLVARSANNTSSFIIRERIKSTCFIPIGLKSERLGALFLNYQKPRTFDKMFRFTCLSLAQSLAKVTAQVRYRDMIYNSFGRPEINLHNVLGRHGLKEGVLQRANTLWQSCDTTPSSEIEACPLYTICLDTDNFITEISLAESSMPPNFWQENLEARLRAYFSSLPNLQNGRRPQIDLQKDPQIEWENPWVKLALYRITTEAINNAILHGYASRVVIHIKRNQTSLHLCIKNNGLPLPPDALKNASRNGIFYLLEQFLEKFGAERAEIRQQEGGKGSVVTIACPALPLVIPHC